LAACSPLDAIGLAFTSSSFKIGPDSEQELLQRLASVSHGIKLQTTGTAAVSAIRQLDLARIAVMAPSWFDDQLCREGEAYFAHQSIDVISATPSGPSGGPLTITAAAMADAVKELVANTGAQAVFIAGNGQRAIGAIDYIEEALGITVLTANQVLLWACLDGTGLRNRVSGYGRLFTHG
jgi:maleate isomerase